MCAGEYIPFGVQQVLFLRRIGNLSGVDFQQQNRHYSFEGVYIAHKPPSRGQV